MSWIPDQAALIWLAVAILLGVIEVLTLDLFCLMLAAGALAGALTAWAGGGWTVSTLVAVVVALLLVAMLRPLLLHRLSRTPARPSGVAALIGRPVEVTETVSSRGGLVKLAGETWTARSEDLHPIPAGSHAWVVRIDGATAVVSTTPPITHKS